MPNPTVKFVIPDDAPSDSEDEVEETDEKIQAFYSLVESHEKLCTAFLKILNMQEDSSDSDKEELDDEKEPEVENDENEEDEKEVPVQNES